VWPIAFTLSSFSIQRLRTKKATDASQTLTNGEKLASCEIAFVPIGVKATVMRNGKLLYARTFPTGDKALEWAEEERVKMLVQGWSVATPSIQE
jgi:hypothetical protein